MLKTGRSFFIKKKRIHFLINGPPTFRNLRYGYVKYEYAKSTDQDRSVLVAVCSK